jgi:hypothetical protein
MSISIINMSRLKRFSTNDMINFRRARVAEYCLKSIPIPEQARLLGGVSEKTIKRDIAYLSEQARQNLHQHLSEDLPWLYESSLQTLDYVKRTAFELADKQASADDKTKLQALRLVAETEALKFKLLQDGPNILAMHKVDQRLRRIENVQQQEQRQELTVIQ